MLVPGAGSRCARQIIAVTQGARRRRRARNGLPAVHSVVAWPRSSCVPLTKVTFVRPSYNKRKANVRRTKALRGRSFSLRKVRLSFVRVVPTPDDGRSCLGDRNVAARAAATVAAGIPPACDHAGAAATGHQAARCAPPPRTPPTHSTRGHQAARRPPPPRPPLTPPALALHAPEILSGTVRRSTNSALMIAFCGHIDGHEKQRLPDPATIADGLRVNLG